VAEFEMLSRSSTAFSARRTATSSNGGTCVLRKSASIARPVGANWWRWSGSAAR